MRDPFAFLVEFFFWYVTTVHGFLRWKIFWTPLSVLRKRARNRISKMVFSLHVALARRYSFSISTKSFRFRWFFGFRNLAWWEDDNFGNTYGRFPQKVHWFCCLGRIAAKSVNHGQVRSHEGLLPTRGLREWHSYLTTLATTSNISIRIRDSFKIAHI